MPVLVGSKMAASMIEKIAEEFAQILDIEGSEDAIQYLFNIEDETDVRDYLHGLIDADNPDYDLISEKLLAEWRKVHLQKKAGPAFKVYKKPNEDDKYFSGTGEKQRGKKSRQNKQKSPSSQESTETESVPTHTPDGDKKKKFVPLFSQEGQERSVIRLPGRHSCNCLAAKHKLVNNCLQCGRIVCEQEGSGPCTFCGALVCTREEKAILDRGSKKSDKLLQKLMTQGAGEIPMNGKSALSNLAASIGEEHLAKAVKNKERLLEYDRNCVKRTQVIDDECDYFAMDGNQWLSKEERSKLKKREEELYQERHASRRNQKITIDFAGRRVVEEEENTVNMYDSSDAIIQEVYHGVLPPEDHRPPTREDFSPLLHPNMPKNIKPPKFVDEDGKLRRSYVSAVHEESEDRKRSLRIQDAELMEMTDQGKCLSMHQPWASLLVAGIKMHEGRTWYSTHRGRLWIASTMKEPYQEDIDALESQYRRVLGDNLTFPQYYPRSCLLGCVEVVDCLPLQEYREQYPNGDSDSPNVLICRNPHELTIKFPIQGQHKIYKLDSQTHKAAKLGVLRDAAKHQQSLEE